MNSNWAFAIRVRGPFQRLLGGLEAVPTRVQQLPDLLRAHGIPLHAQFVGELARTLRRPAQRRLGIATRDRVHERFEGRDHLGHRLFDPRAPGPARRTATTSAALTPPRNSSRPARIVVRDNPVARSTVAIPPSPNASASAPAHRRVRRSSMTGLRARNFVRTVSSVMIMPRSRSHSTRSVDPRIIYAPADSQRFRVSVRRRPSGLDDCPTGIRQVWRTLVYRPPRAQSR
jgi:hypothetical protein